jgi:hypothetical protein
MKPLKFFGLLGTLLFALSACVENGDYASGPATKGNLSPEAIRLQSQSAKLVSLAEEQSAAKKRLSGYAGQGAVVGAGIGALAGALLCAQCSSADRNLMMVSLAAAGAGVGSAAGKQQADTQNTAAAAENTLRRRIQLSDAQLTETQSARARAEKIVRENQNRLAKLQKDVKAGRASQEELALARADARADAGQILAASKAMSRSASSMDQDGNKTSTQIKQRQKAVEQEQNRTAQAHEALVDSLSKSAL